MSLFGDGLEILKLVDRGRNAPLYSQLGEWIDKVADLQKQDDELKGENAALREELRFKGVLERIGGHTFVQGDDEEICSRCAEIDARAVHLRSRTHQKSSGVSLATCPQCHTATELPNAITRDLAQRRAVRVERPTAGGTPKA